jgi:uncharacterized membrane protein YphA (DoxX/SURF4 family)
MSSWQWLGSVLHEWQGMGILLARLSVGPLFAISGGSKLFAPARRDEMRRTITAAGLPAPAMSAVLISSVEFIADIFLVLGFLTPLCCLLLIGNMLGALGTTVRGSLKRVTKQRVDVSSNGSWRCRSALP